MGLAASQARLLTITARKADCEFQSMTLSHQKLSLSRDMERISDQYQNSLNLTKLVYDFEGTGDSTMPLTYDLLMTPNIYNNYYPKLVTDNNNRCILNANYAAAARAAGIPAEGLSGTPSSDIRNKFIQALASNGGMKASVAAAVQTVPYGNTLGLGSTISTTVGIDELNYEQLLDRIKAYAGTGTEEYGIALGGHNRWYRTAKKGERGFTCEELYIGNNRVQRAPEEGADSSGGINISSGYNLTLYQLLSGEDVVLRADTRKSEMTPVYEAAMLQQTLVGEGGNGFLDWMLDQFSAVLGGSAENQLALQYAYNQLFDLIAPNDDLQNIGKALDGGKYGGAGKGGTNLDEKSEWKDSVSVNGTSIKIADTMNAFGTKVAWGDVSGWDNIGANAKDYIGFIFSAKNKDNGDDGKDRTAVAINLSNLANAFLTSYVQFLQGESSKYGWDKGEKKYSTLYDPAKDDFTFSVIGETQVNDGDSDLYASFYDTLFNMICVNGWTQNEQVDDKDYMAEMMKNGQAFISSLSDDGFYYQNQYSQDIYVREVSDTEAIAQAQAKYNTEKAKIENKEDTIDIKMKNLETEISALTTEYDTAKSIITKAIEKSFKRYEA